MITAIISPLMLILIVIFITAFKMNRLMAGFIGAITVAFFLLYIDNISTNTVVGFIVGTNNSNIQTILFIFGMMIIITICQRSGVFIFIAFRLVQFSKGNSRLILVILCFFTFIFSSVSMNILCIFLVIPLTITICKILRINPLPFILSEGMIVNLGGLLFVISSIPNLLISQSINWSFSEYFLDVGFFSIFLFFITTLFLIRYNKEKLETAEDNYIKRLLEYDPWIFVENKNNFYMSSIMLLTTIMSVILIPLFMNITIDIISLTGGIITIVLVAKRDFESVWKELDLELIFYLFCILFISEAIEFTGILNFAAIGIENVTGGNSLNIVLVILWVSALMSSVVHNAPITKIFIPIVNHLSTPLNQKTFFSATSIGTVLGENLSTMGDNLTLIVMVRSYGYELKFSTFMKISIIITIIQLITSSIFLIMKVSIQFLFIGIVLLIVIVFLSYYYSKVLHFFHSKLNFINNKEEER